MNLDTLLSQNINLFIEKGRLIIKGLVNVSQNKLKNNETLKSKI